jgi:hypothetical protein
MVAVGFLSWVELLFPAWVLALSLYRRGQDDGPGIVPT